MGTVPNPAQERVYPLARPDDDPRFSIGLLVDVIKVLTDHGYPPITSGGDIVELQMALFGFIYAPSGDPSGSAYSDLSDRLSVDQQPVPDTVLGLAGPGRAPGDAFGVVHPAEQDADGAR